MISLIEFFTDPILRAPTIASIIMCMATALVGVILFLRKETLLGEALSHSAYPGVVLSALFASIFIRSPGSDGGLSVLVGASLSALLGLKAIGWLQKRLKMHSDAALCLILSTFFGVGVLLASRLQVTHSLWYKQVHVYLYGQAATMVDSHIVIYAVLALVTLVMVISFYRFVQWIYFDRAFAQSVGARFSFVEGAIEVLIIFSIVIGMRCVGVVLLSGMLIAPAVAARAWTYRLSSLFILASLLGGFSGFFGNYLSVWLPQALGKESLALPTGPMILLTATTLSLVSLCFAPQAGLFFRCFRRVLFKNRCALENFLKRLWREGEGRVFSAQELKELGNLSPIRGRLLLRKVRRQGWVTQEERGEYRLSSDGFKKASRIVRLHRLWEVYLVDYVGQHKDKVHASAEHMEHILSPKLERELTKLLKNPVRDPHEQPIPGDNESLLGK